MKKTLTIILTLAIILSSCCVSLYAYAEEKEFESNKLILENLLNERSWVLETIVEGDFTGNPYDGGATLMEQELENYSESLGFKAVVNGLIYYDNMGGEIVSLTVDEYQNLKEAFGFSTDGDVDQFLKDACQSLPERTYESILNEVFTANYTSTAGMKLSDDEDDLSSIRSLKKQFGYFKDFNSLITATVSTGEYKDRKDAIENYADFVEAYGENLDNFEEGFSDYLAKPTSGSAVRKRVMAFTNYYAIRRFQSIIMPEMGSSEFISNVSEVSAPKASKVFKNVEKVIKLGECTLQNILLIEEIQEQKDTTLGLLNRLESKTDSNKLISVIENYKSLTSKTADEKTIAYKSITDFMSENKVFAETGEFLLKKVFKCIRKVAEANKNFSSMLSIGKSMVSAKELFDVGLVIVDGCTGIKETSKKIYELVRINEILDIALEVYNEDLANYKANSTDENAAKVLDDLNFIKRLRLRGETVAYNAVKNQVDSLFGNILAKGFTSEDLEPTYKRHVDAFIGATLDPNSFSEFEITKGKRGFIMSYEDTKWRCNLYDEKDELEGMCCEFENVAMGGVKLTDSILEIVNNTQAPFYIPCLYVVGDCELKLRKSTDLIIGEIACEGKLTVTVEDAGPLEVGIDVNFSGDDATVDGYIDLNGVTYGSGKITTVLIDDNVDKVLKGNINVNNLTLDSTGYITFADSVTVSNSIYNTKTKTKKYKNLILTDNCSIVGNEYYGGFTASNWSTNAPILVDGNLYSENINTVGGSLTVNGTLDHSTNGTLAINGDLNVLGDINYSSGNITGIGNLNIYGDANICNVDVSCVSLNFVGKSKQNLNVTDSVTIENLSNKNKSLSGLDVNSKVTVTKSLYTEENSKYKNGGNIVITGDCTLNNKPVNGSLTASNWVCSDDNVTITDTLYLTGDITLKEGKTLNVENYCQSGGTTTLEKNSILSINKEALFNNGCINLGSVKVNGDIISNGELSSGDYIVGGDFNSNSTVDVNSLTLNSKIPQTYYSTSTSKVNKLILDNNSLAGVRINSVIDVYEEFSNNAKKVVGLSNIHVLSNNYSGSSTINGDFIVDSDFVVPAGENFVINGDLIVKNSATLSFGEKSTITVNGSLKTTSASVNIPVNSSIVVKENTVLSSANVVVNGSLKTEKDISASSGSITGSGVLDVSGDFYASSLTTSGVNLVLNSKVPQTISGSTFNFNNITCNNTSKSGVVLNSQVKYSGELELNDSNVINSDEFVPA